MENLLAIRVPAAIVALLILGLRIITAIVGTVVYSGTEPGGFALSAGEFAYRTVDSALVVILVLLVASCVVVNPVRGARSVTRASAVVVGLSILVALTLAILGASRGGVTVGLDALDTALLLAAPLLGFIVLVRLLELAPAPTHPDGPETDAARSAGGAEDHADREPADPALQPTWQPDVAAGAAWHTAGDAAAGAPASGWGRPGESADWAPRADPPGEAEATRPNPPD